MPVAEKGKERDSNFELLRIFAMIGIIFHHLQQHGIWFAAGSSFSVPFLLSHFFQAWVGMICNWIFVLISGYFICKASFSWKKFFLLWFQVFSISALLTFIALLAKVPVVTDQQLYEEKGFLVAAHPVTAKDALRFFMPCYFGNNWFAVAYLVFYLFVPFLNLFLKHLSQKEHRQLLVLMAVLGLLVKQLPFQGFFLPDTLFLFMLGYFSAAYIRLYNPPFMNHTKLNVAFALACCGVFIAWNGLVYTVLIPIPFVERHLQEVAGFWGGGMPRVLSFMCALLIFCCVKNLHIPRNRFINKVASCTFGVYLFHENLLVNKYLWHVLLRSDEFSSSKFLLVYMICASILVFALCTVLELVRKQLLEKPMQKLIAG